MIYKSRKLSASRHALQFPLAQIKKGKIYQASQAHRKADRGDTTGPFNRPPQFIGIGLVADNILLIPWKAMFAVLWLR